VSQWLRRHDKRTCRIAFEDDFDADFDGFDDSIKADVDNYHNNNHDDYFDVNVFLLKIVHF